MPCSHLSLLVIRLSATTTWCRGYLFFLCALSMMVVTICRVEIYYLVHQLLPPCLYECLRLQSMSIESCLQQKCSSEFAHYAVKTRSAIPGCGQFRQLGLPNKVLVWPQCFHLCMRVVRRVLLATVGLPAARLRLERTGFSTGGGFAGFVKDGTPGSWEFACHVLLLCVHGIPDTRRLGVCLPYLLFGAHRKGDI